MLISIGLIVGLFLSPPDYQQGETVRIMYIHVSAAWVSLFAYVLIFFLSLFYIIWKFPLFVTIAKEVPMVAITFTLITLITGSLWGKPTWGTYWVWDARLTSFLILLFIYMGLVFIDKAFKYNLNGNISFCYLSIIGGINIPIIKFSVDWWNTLHQPASVIRVGGPSISIEMLVPLLVMSLGVLFLFIFLILTNVESAIYEKKFLILNSEE
jgi:heme exporter protein C